MVVSLLILDYYQTLLVYQIATANNYFTQTYQDTC